jgi:protein-tyrosine phosphatase
MAQALCNDEILRRLGLSPEGLDHLPLRAVSAGLTARPGRPFSEASQIALQQLGVFAHQHSSQEVTSELVEQAERIFCMTEEQCGSLASRFPEAASKVLRLDPDGDLQDPSGQDFAVFLLLAARMQKLVRHRISEMMPA